MWPVLNKSEKTENERAKQHTTTQILELAEAGYKVASILTVKDVIKSTI